MAMIGLGRMGMNMAKRLLRGGHEVVAYNRSPEKTNAMLKEEGAIGWIRSPVSSIHRTAPQGRWGVRGYSFSSPMTFPSMRLVLEIIMGQHDFVSLPLQQELTGKLDAGCAFGILNAPNSTFDPSTDADIVRNYGPQGHATAKRENKSNGLCV